MLPGLCITATADGFLVTLVSPTILSTPYLHENVAAGSWEIPVLPFLDGTQHINDLEALTLSWFDSLGPRLYRRGLQFAVNESARELASSTCTSPATGPGNGSSDAWVCTGVEITASGRSVPCASILCSEDPCPVYELDPGAIKNNLVPYCVAHVPYGAAGSTLNFRTKQGLTVWTQDNAAVNWDGFRSYVYSRDPNARIFAFSGVIGGIGIGLLTSCVLVLSCQ